MRDNGGHAVALKWSMDARLRHGRGRDVLGRVRHRLGRRPLLHRLRAAAARAARRSSTRASRSARRIPGAFWRADRAARRERALHGADRLPRDQEGRPAGRAHRASTTSRASARSSSPASAAIPTRCSGRASGCSVPVIDHWWQTETGWPIAANCVGLGMLPVKPGSPTKPVPGYDVRVLDERQPGDAARARSARSRSSCRCRRAACPRSGTTTPASRSRTSTRHPGYYLTGDAGYQGRRRLRLHHESRGRHHQRGRPSALHGRDGGSARRASRRRRVRGGRRGRRDQGRGAGGLRRHQGGRDARRRRDRAASWWRWCASSIGPVAAFKTATVVKRLPKTRSGKILRGTDEEDRRRRRVHGARHHRRPGDPRTRSPRR